MRTVFWDYENNRLQMIDQRRLPIALEVYSCHTYEETVTAIRNMVIRGAPAIGVCAAFALVLAANQSNSIKVKGLLSDLKKARNDLQNTRPTAINLAWGLEQVMKDLENFHGSVEELRTIILTKAQNLADDDVILNKRIATFGADLIENGDTIIHHCNTGALAAVDWGTALGSIRMAHEQGKHVHVLVDETRPRLQGSRLTAWELEQYDIPYDIISDNMAGYFLRSGIVNKVMFGADRVAANGDIANKIGTYMLALAAHENQIPVYAFLPTSTLDCALENGDLIPIEERPQDEVLEIYINGERATPKGAHARNPAFDVTPNHLIDAIITEKGVIFPPYCKSIDNLLNN